jgi:hypothetical protein
MELNKQITIKTIPILIIIFLSFIILFSETKLTIIMATNLPNILLVVLIIITQIFLYYLSNNNFTHYNYNQYKICIILLSILMSIMLVYILYIKRIYDEEFKIINQLKEKDIIADTNVAC